MKVKELILSTLATIFVINSSIVIAEEKIVFPTENAVATYLYPPQAPIQRNIPIAVPRTYIFGQNNSTKNSFNPNNRSARDHQQQQPNRIQSSYPRNNVPFNNAKNSFPFSNNMNPFVNSNNMNPFSRGNMPFSNNSSGMIPKNPMNNMFSNNNMGMPFTNNNSNRKKAWGTKRNIWPDFYTDFTDEAWDSVTSAPRDLGRMPGGWRFPYISTPDPVTVSDAITNQFPPIAEEAGNMMDFSDWGVFD